MEDLVLTHKVASYECGEDHLLKPECFMLLCQEMAESHAQLHGFGYDWGMQSRMIWVEVQGCFEFLRRPTWKETVTLRTNTGTASALQARRFVEMSDAEGRVIARADLLWVLINFDTRRPIPLRRAKLDPSVTSECPPITTPPAEPSAWPEPQPDADITAPRRDVDFNGHINNSAYLIWALDALPAEARPGAAPARFRLQFRRESFCGEKLQVKHATVGKLTRHLITDGTQCRAELCIEWA